MSEPGGESEREAERRANLNTVYWVSGNYRFLLVGPAPAETMEKLADIGPEPLCFVNQQLALRRKCPLWVSSRLSRHRSVSPLSAISGHWGGMGQEEDPLEVA